MLRLSPTTISKPQLYIYYFTIAHFVTVWWNYEPRLNPLIHNFIPNSLMHLVSEAVKEHDIDICRVAKKKLWSIVESSKEFSLHKQTILFYNSKKSLNPLVFDKFLIWNKLSNWILFVLKCFLTEIYIPLIESSFLRFFKPKLFVYVDIKRI